MRSNSRKTARIGCGLLLLATASCGLLGEKAPALRNLAYKSDSMGCLNGFSGKLKQYADGSISESEWNSSIECVSKNISLFSDFVEPTEQAGYSLEDMRAFVARFLLTTGPVSVDLVRAGFELKAALLGGSTDHISPAELKLLLSNLGEIRRITLDLLPQLRLVNSDPTDENFIALSEMAVRAGEKLAALLPAEAKASLSADAVRKFIAECRSFGIDLDPALEGAVMAGKVLVVGGSPDAIEPDSWRELARQGGRVAGPVLLMLRKAGPDEKPLLDRRLVVTDILSRAAHAMESAMARHGGKWSLPLLDRLVDALPASLMPYDRAITKGMLRPLAQKFLRSRVTNALDLNAVHTVRELADLWSRGESVVNQIFGRIGADSAPWQRVIEASEEFLAGFSDPATQEDVRRIIGLVRRFRPLMAQGDRTVHFDSQLEYSRTYLSKLNALNLAAVHFIASYEAPRGAGSGLKESDLGNFFADFLPFAGELKLMDPTTLDIASKRFRDMDLFTLASDGNGYLSEEEVTYFLVYASSIASMTGLASDLVVPRCPSAGPDPFGTEYVGIECFESNFFPQGDVIWGHFGGLSSYYASRGAGDQKKLRDQMAMSARRYGLSQLPVGSLDIQGYAGLAHYVESILFRFDRDGNGVLNLNETLGAYPLFKRLLVEIGKLDPKDDKLGQAVFTYLVKYQKIPKKDLSFITWYLTRPFWKISADRGALFGLISKISKPEPLPAGAP